MYLVPTLPPVDDETTVSWCARLARFHANLSSTDWLKVMQLNRKHVMETSNYCITRLSDLTGIPTSRIVKCGVQFLGERLYRYGAEQFSDAFMTRSHTSYCPACLLEDTAVGSESWGQRVGRVSWIFATTRICPKHGTELVRRHNTHQSEWLQEMNIVAPEKSVLLDQAATASEGTISPLQTYVTERLAGKSGPLWLDNQRIDQASRACEMLGICRTQGAFVDLREPALADWNEAGAVGYAAASQGPEGIFGILEEIVEAQSVRQRYAGPQVALGRIYQWLQFNKSQRDPGPVQDCIRDFIVDTMPVDPGTALFGKVIERTKRHTVQTLAKKSGVHPMTISRALAQSGILHNPNPAKIHGWATCDAATGEALADRIIRSVPVQDGVMKYLNCNRTQAQMLVKSGILPPVAPGPKKRYDILAQVPLDEMDAFLKSFRSKGRPVASASEGMMNVIEASEVARETATDIARMVLDGHLSKIEILDEALKFRSVLVDPEEIVAVANASENEHGLSVAEAARRLRVITTGITHLRTKLDKSGRPFLKATEIINARGTVRYRFAVAEVQRFLDLHVSLTELANAEGVALRVVSNRLSKAGIEPIMYRGLLRSKVFRRSDL